MLKSELDAIAEHLAAENARAVKGADYFVAGLCFGILAGYILKTLWG